MIRLSATGDRAIAYAARVCGGAAVDRRRNGHDFSTRQPANDSTTTEGSSCLVCLRSRWVLRSPSAAQTQLPPRARTRTTRNADPDPDAKRLPNSLIECDVACTFCTVGLPYRAATAAMSRTGLAALTGRQVRNDSHGVVADWVPAPVSGPQG